MTKDEKVVVDAMIAKNEPQYQLLKALEELSELQTALLQFITKDGRKTTKQDVIDEIGDVKIRIRILETVFGKEKVDKRVHFKLCKFEEYMHNGLFTGKI
jgi:hypothetical protein